ncbi:MAG: hypothetical protein J0L75_01290 [Spirochaetes bacterium]|nr:hypothetical protein [Spirochaetota bacterium]
MGQTKDWMTQVIRNMPEDASFEEIVRELVMRRPMEDRRSEAPSPSPEPRAGWTVQGGIRPWQKRNDE